jgi:hypothetical protein
MTQTQLTIVTAVRDRLDETVAGQWSDAQLRRWINEGARDMARRTKHLKDTTTISTVSGTAEYTVDADVLEVEQAYYAPGDGRQVPLIARAWEGMNAVWGQYRDQQGGDPAMFTTWGFSPNLKIRLFPVPSTSSKTVTLYVSRLPADLATDGSANGTAIDFPDAWIDGIYDFVTYQALFKDRDQRWTDAKTMYEQRVDDMLVGGEYMGVAMEMVADPLVQGGVLPRWLVDPGYSNW